MKSVSKITPSEFFGLFFWSGIHDKEERSKHRTLGDSTKEFAGIGPDGQDLNGLETMFNVANHPL